jgi:hypothetical protein
VAGPSDETTRIDLARPVLSQRVPSTRPTRQQLESLLGARFVSADEGWLLDFERSDAPGRRAGLERADRIVTAWPEGNSTRVIVYRKGAGYVDIRVPGS